MLVDHISTYHLTEDEVLAACLLYIVSKRGAATYKGTKVAFVSKMDRDSKIRKMVQFGGVSVTLKTNNTLPSPE